MAIACFTANCAHIQFATNQFMILQGGSSGQGCGFVCAIVGDDQKTQQVVTTCLFGIAALPFCFKRRLGELRFVSLGVVFFSLFVTVVVVSKMTAAMFYNQTTYNTE